MRDNAEPTAAGQGTRSTSPSSSPRPPTSRKKKSRPCASTGGRKEDRRRFAKSFENSPKYKPVLVKLNRWYLDADTGTPVKVSLKDKIPQGVRVIEQPIGLPSPSFPQFYDFNLLPKGSSLTSAYSSTPKDEDPEMRSRLFTALKLLGVGKDTRRHMYDRLMLSANPLVAVSHVIEQVCGQESLSAPANSLTKESLKINKLSSEKKSTRSLLENFLADAINISNAQTLSPLPATDFETELPAVLGTREELAPLSKIKVLPGAKASKKQRDAALHSLKQSHDSRQNAASIVSINYVNSRTELVLSCKNSWQVQALKATLLQSGGERIQWDSKAHRATISDDYRKLVPVTDIYVSFACSPAEVAHALGGTQPKVSYSVVGDLVHASHSSNLHGETYTNPSVICGPSLTAVTEILKVAERSDANFQSIVSDFRKVVCDPYSATAEIVGPSNSVSHVAQRIAALSLEDLLDADTITSLRALPKTIKTKKGDSHAIDWRDHEALTDIVVSHGVDTPHYSGFYTTLGRGTPTKHSSVDDLPATIEGPHGEKSPVKVLNVRFYKDEHNTLVAQAEVVDASSAVDTRKKWLNNTDVKDVIWAECEAAVLGLVSKTVLKGMRTPKSPNDEDKRSVSDIALKQARNKFEPYALEGGEMLLLVQVLAANDADDNNEEWGNFCQESIGEFYKKVSYERGRKKQNFKYSNIWSYLAERPVEGEPQTAEDYSRNILNLTQSMLSSRAGRQVTEEETKEMAGRLRASLVSPSSREPGKLDNGKLFYMGVDRGKAMHHNAAIPTPRY